MSIETLKKIISDTENREDLIKEFQELVWEDDSANEILSELAQDLDYYQPDETKRLQDSSYYGEEELERRLSSAIQRLTEEGQ